ncbi:DUF4625 domain-containing protein [Pedobacter sp. SYP-B3415]|uniref:DUF4625 domain-containing protein n=1 Tax=Pedobacter sp. SYP-B3415 TaxID=2496641 RepID=UPI00101E1CE7|nr:DUF4625 domain-containing protein [Pedobacter sp. SYP-B3415]
MKKTTKLLIPLACLILAGCSKDETPVDTTYPVIDLAYQGASPQQCGTFTRGQKISFKARFSDNVALGSYSIDVHHNFDHHSHSTEVNDCALEPKKTAVKPYLLIRNFPIEGSPASYEAVTEFDIPADADPGDYHFLVRLTDREGWQTLKGISIKIK